MNEHHPHDGLNHYWEKTVGELATRKAPQFDEVECERHRIYLGLLAAINTHYWATLKRGREGKYNWNPKIEPGTWLDSDYRGHNIAALAVSRKGEVIDFEMNHNALFCSSAEHAEARLIRRVYALADVNKTWDMVGSEGAEDKYINFPGVTVYSTLEPCSQCSGIMTLAKVGKVIYLQPDPGMYNIGNILRNLTEKAGFLVAPDPIPASAVGFKAHDALDEAFVRFEEEVSKTPFHEPTKGKPDTSPSLTSFLCTKAARDIYKSAAYEFLNANVDGFDDKPREDGALSNRSVYREAKDFYEYAITGKKRAASAPGTRGTPHR